MRGLCGVFEMEGGGELGDEWGGWCSGRAEGTFHVWSEGRGFSFIGNL